MNKLAFSLALAISVKPPMTFAAQDEQEHGYYVPGQHEALGKPGDFGYRNGHIQSHQRADEGFHADNKFMRIASFEKGQRLYAMMLHALVDQPVLKSK